jgi:hypothetical protein
MKRLFPNPVKPFQSDERFSRSRRLLIKILLNNRSLKSQYSGSEQGYILQVAILTALVLIIGIAAFASRTGSGLFGVIDQSLNREARDVAESAITDFQNALNRVENRYLLVKGNTSWSANDFNPCLSTTNSSGTVTGEPTVANRPTSATLTRYAPSTVFKNLNPGASGTASRQFRVERIDYFNSARNALDSDSRDDVVSGATRALLRVTVVGQVEKNGNTSASRVSREFEVVPKCCNRSFGRNVYGGVNWGRDSTACTLAKPSTSEGNGIIGALNGGNKTKGSANDLNVTNQNGEKITKAICWSGNLTNQSDLEGSPSSECKNNGLDIGNTNTGKAISLIPTPFNLQLPVWDDFLPVNASGIATRNTATMTGSSTVYYIYFNTSSKKLRKCLISGTATTPASALALINAGATPESQGGCTDLVNEGDPCRYKNIDYLSTPPVPYYEAACRLSTLNSSSNNTVIFDTSNAKINLFFDDPNPPRNTEYMGGGGGTTFMRVHCRKSEVSLAEAAVGGDGTLRLEACNEPLSFTEFQRSCSFYLTGCTMNYDMSELLNVYATGDGDGGFKIKGTSAGLGFNLIAPYSSITLVGGGKSDPVGNFMGRIWGNDITLTGNVGVQTLSSNPAFCKPEYGGVGDKECPPTGKLPFFDFIARSFSHASGF